MGLKSEKDLSEESYQRRVRYARIESLEKMQRVRGLASFTPFVITDRLLLRHILILGATGSGKTNHAFHFIRSAMQTGGQSCLIIDVKKEYRRLKGILQRDVRVLAVADEPRVRFNPLAPPEGIGVDHWDRAFADVFTRSYGLSEPSRRVLLDSLANLREADRAHPTLRELELEVAKFPAGSTKEQGSRRSLESRLHNINTGPVGVSVNADDALDIPSMGGAVTIYEIGKVDSLRDQRFLAELVLAQLWHYDREHVAGGVEERLGRLVVVEEAHRYLSEERPPNQRGDRTLLELSIAEARRYGWGFIIVDQMPLLLSRYVWDNSGTVIAHRLTNMDTYKVVRQALGGAPIAATDDSESDPIILRLPEDIAVFHRYIDPAYPSAAVGFTLVPRVTEQDKEAGG